MINTNTTDDVHPLMYIWREINISTLLILKIFDSICQDAYHNVYVNVRYPIHYLAYEYGLLNCFLTKDYKFLKLVFDYQVATSNLQKTKSKYYCFADRLIDNKDYFFSIDTYGESKSKLLVITLKIPEVFFSDMLVLMESKFSKTSDLFKEYMKPKYSIIDNEFKAPPIDNNHWRYIICNSIGYRIVTKKSLLAKDIHQALNINPQRSKEWDQNHEYEYFKKWEDKNEIWNINQLNKYL